VLRGETEIGTRKRALALGLARTFPALSRNRNYTEEKDMSVTVPRRPILRTKKWTRENNPNSPGTREYYSFNAAFHSAQAVAWSTVSIVSMSVAVAAQIFSLIVRLAS
jgi:hypothetical protein